MKKAIGLLLLLSLLAGMTPAALAAPSSRWRPGFDVWGGATDTKVQYYFLTEDPFLVYGKEVDHFYTYNDFILAGSDLYIPSGMKDTTKPDVSSSPSQNCPQISSSSRPF